MSDKVPKKYGATTDLVPIKGLIPETRPGAGALLVSPSGAFRMIIKCGAVNFETKDEYSKTALLHTFGGILTSLDPSFPIMIAIHSKMLDTEAYNDQFNSRLNNTNTPDAIKTLIREHLEHFDRHVKQTTLLQKERYIILPFNGEPGWQRHKPTDDIPLAGLFKQFFESQENRVTRNEVTEAQIVEARQTLEVRSERIVTSLNQMDISTERLGEEGVRKLLYEYYHPERARIQSVPGVRDGGTFMPSVSAGEIERFGDLSNSQHKALPSFGTDEF